MNALTRLLADLIARQGPMSVARYMEAALGHPEHGYYMSRQPFGASGDFVTAPDVSQMFGELIGLWCASQWRAMGQPKSFSLIELGPGRGVLMSDALRAARVVPGFAEAADLRLIEMSPALRAVQGQRLSATWHDRLSDTPADRPLILVANEFFDALPIRQFVRTGGAWRERLVGLAEEKLCFVLSDLQERPGSPEAAEGEIFEICEQGVALAKEIAQRISSQGGAALIVDYGHGRSGAGDTLQAVRGHAYHSVLEDPGEADLTAHVDFSALAEAVKEAGACVWGPAPQGRFLRALGIRERAAALSAKADPNQRKAVHGALQRLTDPSAMGHLFKAMAVTAPGLAEPAGFEE